jgi:AraC-like DNA-binding protein
MHDSHAATIRSTSLAGVRVASFASNRSFPRHSHDEFGVGVIDAGAQRSWSGRGLVDALPGDVITVNAGEVHDGVPVNACVRNWQMLYIEPSVVTTLTIDTGTKEFAFAQPSARNPRGQRAFRVAFAHAVRAECAIAIESAILLLLLRLSGTASKRVTSRSSAPPILAALEMIDASPASPHSLHTLASAVGVGKFQLLRGFSKHFGITPYAYVLQRRVQVARRAILRGEPLTHAALASGFADQSHMTRAIMRQYGLTPSQLRSTR